MHTVTIGLPVYNGEAYLSQALESLLNQTYENFLLIISDNASQDNTQEICESAARADRRVRYVRQATNLGAIGNFNCVAQAAESPYFKWAAYDDLCAPTFLQRCVEVLDARPEVAWCHCESDQIDAEGQSWLTKAIEAKTSAVADLVEANQAGQHWKGHPRHDHDAASPARRFAGVLLGTTWSVDAYGLIRTEALRRTRLILPYYGAEKVLMGELALLGKYYHIPEMLFSQRVHEAASSCLTSATGQAQFAVGAGGRQLFPRLALLRAHFGAVHHMKLGLVEKSRAYFAVLRYLFQFGKWKNVVASSLRGRGVGGDRPFFSKAK